MKRLSILLIILLAGTAAFTAVASAPASNVPDETRIVGTPAPAAIPDPVVASTTTAPVRAQVSVRIKDITHVTSARDNQLMGYGIVVGLQGTGDSASFQLTAMSICNMLQRMGISVPLNKMKKKNAAAVM
ncbi:MAG TPA: flagellar basal body P-ring protein FlgI, partial [Armatimonadota bacterium]